MATPPRAKAAHCCRYNGAITSGHWASGGSELEVASCPAPDSQVRHPYGAGSTQVQRDTHLLFLKGRCVRGAQVGEAMVWLRVLLRSALALSMSMVGCYGSWVTRSPDTQRSAATLTG